VSGYKRPRLTAAALSSAGVVPSGSGGQQSSSASGVQSSSAPGGQSSSASGGQSSAAEDAVESGPSAKRARLQPDSGKN